jgi:hypothetical protein
MKGFRRPVNKGHHYHCENNVAHGFLQDYGPYAVLLANRRVGHFVAQCRAPAAFLCTLAAQWVLGGMLVADIGTLFANIRTELTQFLRPRRQST